MSTTYYKFENCYLCCQQGHFSVVFGTPNATVNDLVRTLNEGGTYEFEQAYELIEAREVPEPPTPVSEVVEEFLNNEDIEYSEYRASTGSTYITVVNEDDEAVVIRIADHLECYPPNRTIVAQVTINRNETNHAEIKTAVAAVIAKIGYTL